MRLVLCLLAAASLSLACAAKPGLPLPDAAEHATSFLRAIGTGDGDAAVKLWDASSMNDGVKARIGRISSKVKALGGIKRIDVGTCEPRRIKSFEEKAGEKIDVVPVEIICGNDSLILAVFSIRKTGEGHRIFLLESLKEWGGTTSLDDELTY